MPRTGSVVEWDGKPERMPPRMGAWQPERLRYGAATKNQWLAGRFPERRRREKERDTLSAWREGLSEALRRPGLAGFCRAYSGRPGFGWNLRRRRSSAYYLEHIERPLVSIHNLCIRWGGDRRYPNTTGDYPFERKIFPSVSST